MTTTATFHLLAITDSSITKTHLGAKEREPGRTWCGVQLLVKGDARFGGRYADGPGFTSSADLEAVTCGACKRTAAWKGQKGGKYAVAQARPKAAPGAVPGSSVIDADPVTGLPRIKPEIQAKADEIVAGQKARNAR